MHIVISLHCSEQNSKTLKIKKIIHIRMVSWCTSTFLYLYKQLVQTIPNFASSNSVARCSCNWGVQNVSDLRQIGGFLPTNKSDVHDTTEILLKVANNQYSSFMFLTWRCDCLFRHLNFRWVSNMSCTNFKNFYLV